MGTGTFFETRLIDTENLAEISLDILKKRRGRLRLPATGSSMHPTISDGDSVELSYILPANLIPGEIVFCRRADGALIIHRIIKKIYRSDGLYFVTKGDANAGYDDPVKAENIIGKVTAVLKDDCWLSLDNNYLRGQNYLLAKALAVIKSAIDFLYRIKKRLLGDKKVVPLSLVTKKILAIFPKLMARNYKA